MNARSAGPQWGKAPPELIAAFDAAMSDFPGIERRPMFGYPAAFANGHLVTGLFQDRWMVRLPDDALASLAAAGGAPFEPMAGRPMRGYLTFPPEMVSDPAAVRPWLDRAIAHVRGLPAKATKR